MDLREWDLEKNGPVRLDGEWEFYWKQRLTANNFQSHRANRKMQLHRFPSVWNSYQQNGHKLPGLGFATYRLRVLLKEQRVQLSIKLPEILTAYDLYLNGRLMTSVGAFGMAPQSSRPKYLPQVIDIPRVGGQLEFILHISNFHLNRGGIISSIYLGSKNDITQMREQNLAFELFLFGSLLIMSLYHFGLYFLRRQDPSALYLCLFCLMIAFQVVYSGEKYFISLFPHTPWVITDMVVRLSWYAGLPFFAMFLHSIYPGEFRRVMLRFFQLSCVGFVLWVLFTPPSIYTYSQAPFQFLTILAAVYATYALVRAAFRRREGAVVFLLGFLFFFLTVTNDILHYQQIINTGNFAPLGLFVFILAQTYVLSHRFAMAFKRVESLSSELEGKNRQLLQLDKLKDEFLANTSHELRTPLNGIVGMTEALIQGARGDLEAGLNHDLSVIAASGRRLTLLVNDILDFSKIKHHDLALRTKPIDLSAMVKLVLTLCGPLVGKKDLQLRCEIPEDLPCVLADENRLHQVLQNLMGNAIKFTEQGHITVSAKAVDGKIQIAVRDTGIGIAADNMEKIFRHFEQADGGTARTYGGTGLGLSISKDLIELHGGQIWCESQLGRGSTFFFTMPASSVDAGEESPTISQLLQPPLVIETVENLAGHKSSSPSPSFEGQQIMVVDDEPLNLEVVSTQLMLHNFQAITAAGGPQALEVIERQGIPDLVLLDVMMPHMTGLEVCQTIRQTYSENELPIILLTAKNQIADLIAGFSSGANDYIIKPFSSQELIARIQNHIKIKNLTTEIILHRQNEARIEKDLEAARAVQETLLVPAPDVPDIQTMVYYRSADKTGGDWYGTFYDPHAQRVVVIIGDVTGHGVPAALITGVACGAIRGHFHTIGEASKEQPHLLLKNIANTLNQVIHETSYRSRKSITMAFLALDLPSGQVTYLNAGHPPIYHLAEGGLEVLLIPSHAIGAKQEPALETKQFIAQPGDVFFLFTDGLIENSGPDEARFNTRKLEKLLGASPLEPKAISEKLIEESKTIWQNHPPDDDCTFLILKYLGHNKKAHM